MAKLGDMDELDVRRMFQDIFSGTAGGLNTRAGPLGSSSGGSSSATVDPAKLQKSLDLLNTEANKATKGFYNLWNQAGITKTAQQNQRDAVRNVNDELSKLESFLEAHRKGEIELSNEQRKQLVARRDELTRTQKASFNYAGLINQASSLLGQGMQAYSNYVTTSIQGVTSVLQTVQSGGSGFAIAGAELQRQAAVGMAGAQMSYQASSVAAGGLTQLGVLGAAAGAMIMYDAQKTMMNAQIGNAKFQQFVSIAQAGADSMLKSYKTATAAGAIFSGGIEEMTRDMKQAGLTMEMLTEAIGRNKDRLASSGLGIAESSLYLVRVMKSLRASNLDKSLQAIGIDTQGAMDIMATVVGNMRKRDINAVVSDDEVKRQTMEYAKNLGIISAITGESAKEQMKKARELDTSMALRNLAVKNGLNEQQLEQAKVALAAMPKDIQKAVLQMATIGGTDVKAVILNGPLRQAVTELAGTLNGGSLNAETMANINHRYAGAIGRANDGLASVLGPAEIFGKGGSLANVGADLLKIEESFRAYATNIKTVVATLDKQMTDALKIDPKSITSMMLEFNKQGEMLQAQLQAAIIKNFEGISKMMLDALKHVVDEINAWHISGPPGGGENIMDKMKKWWDLPLDKKFEEAWKWIKENPVLGGLIAAAVVLSSASLIGGMVGNIKNLASLFKGSPKVAGDLANGAIKATEKAGTKAVSEMTLAELRAAEAAGGNALIKRNANGQAIDASGRFISKEAEEGLLKSSLSAGEAGVKAGEKVAEKAAEKAAVKAGEGFVAKSIPLLSIAAGGYFAWERAQQGEYAKAGLELISGILHSTPLFALGYATDAGLLAHDVSQAVGGDNKKSSAPAVPAGTQLVKNGKGEVGYYQRNGRSTNFVPVPGATLPDASATPPAQGRDDRDQQNGTAAKPIVTTPAPNAKAIPVRIDEFAPRHITADGAMRVSWDQTTTTNFNTMMGNQMGILKKSLDDLKTQLATPAAGSAGQTPSSVSRGTSIPGATFNPEITDADLAKLEKEGKTNLQIFALATLIKQNRDSLAALADMRTSLGREAVAMEGARASLATIEVNSKKQLGK